MGGIDSERAHLSSFLSTQYRKNEMALWLGSPWDHQSHTGSEYFLPSWTNSEDKAGDCVSLNWAGLAHAIKPTLPTFLWHPLSKKSFQVQFTWAAFWLRLRPLPTFLCHHPYLEKSFWLASTLTSVITWHLESSESMNLTMYSRQSCPSY